MSDEGSKYNFYSKEFRNIHNMLGAPESVIEKVYIYMNNNKINMAKVKVYIVKAREMRT